MTMRLGIEEASSADRPLWVDRFRKFIAGFGL
jgi:hypothetical protein